MGPKELLVRAARGASVAAVVGLFTMMGLTLFDALWESGEFGSYYTQGMKVEFAGWLAAPFVFLGVALTPLPREARAAFLVIRALCAGAVGGLLAWYVDLLVEPLHDVAFMVGAFSFFAAVFTSLPLSPPASPGPVASRTPETEAEP